MKSDNLIQFKKKKTVWKDENEEGQVTNFSHKTLFKNAYLVDIFGNCAYFVDLLVENGKLQKISGAGETKVEEHTEVVDLEGNFVLPPFVNGFVDWDNVLGMQEFLTDSKAKRLLLELMGMKNVLAGAEFYVSVEKPDLLLQDMDDLSENELSKFSDDLAKSGGQVMMKVGQTLEELGSVDKHFGKALPYVLEDFGFFDRHWVLVGGNCFEKDDLQVFCQQEHPRFVVCPGEDGQVGRRPVNLVLLQKMGFDIRIGSGRAFEIDFFAFMRQILMSQWQMYEDKNCMGETDVFLMATNQVSTLEEGGSANFIVVRNSPTLYDNLLQTLIWGKSKQDVLMTVFEGRIVQRQGLSFSGISGLTQEELVEEICKLNLNKDF